MFKQNSFLRGISATITAVFLWTNCVWAGGFTAVMDRPADTLAATSQAGALANVPSVLDLGTMLVGVKALDELGIKTVVDLFDPAKTKALEDAGFMFFATADGKAQYVFHPESKVFVRKTEAASDTYADELSVLLNPTSEPMKDPQGKIILRWYSLNGNEELINAVLKSINPAWSITPASEKIEAISSESVVSTVAYTDKGERVGQIKDMLKRIEQEEQEAGKGNLPEIYTISDYHGEANLFLKYIADAVSQKTGKTVTLDHKKFPAKSIDEQLKEQGVDIKKIGIIFFLQGDFLDRGPYGVKCYMIAEELMNLGIAQYVTGNHDLWAFLNLMGYHLPVYEGFNFYGERQSVELVKKHWDDSEIVADRFGWWTERLAEYNAAQKQLQAEIFEGKAKEIREHLKALYLQYKEQLSGGEKNLLEDLVGYYFGNTDVYTGFNGIGMMSAQWWEEKMREVNRYHQRAKGSANAVVGKFWEDVKSRTEEAANIVRERLGNAVVQGQWWWRVFNDINRENYTSVEWWGKDWSSHEGWGTTIIDELNELDGGKKWSQANYIKNPHLQNLALFYRKNFNLFIRDAYGNIYTHGWLPVDEETGEITFTYKGTTYQGPYIWQGLEAVQNDVRDLSKPLSELHEALELVNSWYSDKTTRIKPENIKIYVIKVGLEKIFKNVGIRTWFTAHNPQNKLVPKGVGSIVRQGEYVLVSVDKGMSWEKFNDMGCYVIINANGIRMRGYSGPDFQEIVDNPKTVKLDKDTEDKKKYVITKTWENAPVEKADFLQIMKQQLTEELDRLTRELSELQEAPTAALMGKKPTGKYAELWEAELVNGKLENGRDLEGAGTHAKFKGSDRAVVQSKINNLLAAIAQKHGGLGILAAADAIRLVDNIDASKGLPLVPYSAIVKEGNRNIILLDIDAVDNMIVLDHEFEHSIMNIIPAVSEEIREPINELTANYISLKLALESIESGELNLADFISRLKELGADEQFFAALQVLADNSIKLTDDEKIIAVAIEHMRSMPYYADLFKQLPLADDWGKAIPAVMTAKDRYENALKLFNTIAKAKETAAKVKATAGKVDETINNLNHAILKVKMLVSDISLHETAFVEALVKANKYIRLYVEDLQENPYIIEWLKELMKGKDRSPFLFQSRTGADISQFLKDNNLKQAQAPANIERKNIIDARDISFAVEKGLTQDSLSMPMAYSKSGIYLAGQIVLADGLVGEIKKKDPLAYNTLMSMYKALFGNDFTEEMLTQLIFGTLPAIRPLTETIDALRRAIAQVEVAA